MNPASITLIGLPVLAAALTLSAGMLVRWRWGFYGLLLFLPFAGTVSATFFTNPYVKLAKDVLFVIPWLATALLFHLREIYAARLPASVLTSVLFFVTVVLVQTANPNVPNLAVAVVGAKVWLLYIPFILVMSAIIRDETDFTRLMRLLVVLPVLPMVFGFLQYAQSLAGGYAPTMNSYYGPATVTITQRLSNFSFGGMQLFRIPSTFTFHIQYFAYLTASIVPAYTVMRADPEKRWRVFGFVVLCMLVFASLLSGARSAFLLLPVFAGLLLVFERRGGLLLIVAPSLVVLLGSLAAISGVDLIAIANSLQSRFFHRAGTFDPIVGDLVFGLMNFPLGNGVGVNTDAARFVIGNTDRVILESFYGKAVNELGHVGLLAVIFVLLSMLTSSWRAMRALENPQHRTYAVAISAYVVIVIINNAKVRVLDLDPTNVLFWVFAGILFRLVAMAPEPTRSTTTGSGHIYKVPGTRTA